MPEDNKDSQDWLEDLIGDEETSTEGDEVKVPKKFKADGEEFELESGEKALEYIRKGRNYEKKMEAIRPYKQIAELVQNDPVAQKILQERLEEVLGGGGEDEEETSEKKATSEKRGIDPKVYEESLRLGLRLNRADYTAIKGKLIEMIADDSDLTRGEKAAINFDPDTYVKYFEKAYVEWAKDKGTKPGKAGTKPGKETKEPPFVLSGGDKEAADIEGSEMATKAKKIWELPREKFLEKVNKMRGL